MILPHPESNLKSNIMVLGANIIDIMGKSPFKDKYVFIDDIMIQFMKKEETLTPDLFLYTISFLYSIGCIERKEYKIKLVKSINKQPSLFE
jgi:hypothetical protein